MRKLLTLSLLALAGLSPALALKAPLNTIGLEPPVDEPPVVEPAAGGVRTGMTWSVVGQQGAYVHVGSDGLTNPYAGDTTIDQFLPILCVLVDGRPAPGGLALDSYSGWSGGAVQATPAIAATVLTSQAQGDEICADTFGSGWRLAEFHDGGGWSYWAEGSLPAGTRFWVAINDQPANPWNSAGAVPVVAPPKFFPSEAPVPGQYIALLSESTAEGDVPTLANSLVASYGGTILNLLPSAQGFSLTATDAQARAMSLDSRVDSVEENTYGQESQAPPWHLDRIDQRPLPLDGVFRPANDGSNVNIYVLDTGVHATHQEFGGRARMVADFSPNAIDDCRGHGTETSSVAGGNSVGVARRANLLMVRIADCSGSTSASTLSAALDWVTHNHVNPAVVNISFGRRIGFLRRWFHSRTPEDRAVRRAVQAGVTVVVSAGNDGINAHRQTPARADEAITVSATDRTDRRASFANFDKVDLFAPGVGITAAGRTGDLAYVVVDGTSFSAPAVAGAAALYLHDHPFASPDEVRNALLSNATPNVVQNPGSGSANRLLFVALIPATHAGLTWTVLEQRVGAVHVGGDSRSNPYSGDTAATTALPVLCLNVNNSPVPAGITPDFYNGWARGPVGLSLAVPGSQLTSRAVADALCAASFGSTWRMAEFHDGRYGTNLSSSGGWSFWANGGLPAGARFWVAINDQPANPWN